MEYTYKGKNYPKEIKLNHPEIIPILGTIQPPQDEFDHMMSLPAQTLRQDLENILLREIGNMWGKNEKEVEEYYMPSKLLFSCILIYLIRVADVNTTLQVVLELLRQPSSTIYTVLGDDFDNIQAVPVLYALTKDHPSLLKSFLLEEGTSHLGKEIVSELLGRIGLFTDDKRVYKEFADTVLEVMDAYLKDYDNEQKICDKDVISYLVDAASDAGLHDMWDTVVSLFNKGMVNENICGDIDTVLLGIDQASIQNEIETDPEKLMYGMPRDWDFFFPSDGSESGASIMLEWAKQTGLGKDKSAK